MAGIIENILARTRRTDSTGVFSNFATGGGGILSGALGPLQSRMASLQAAGTPQDKIKALTGSLGMRLRTPGGLLAGMRGGTGAPGGNLPPNANTDERRFLAGAQREFANPNPPSGLAFK